MKKEIELLPDLTSLNDVDLLLRKVEHLSTEEV